MKSKKRTGSEKDYAVPKGVKINKIPETNSIYWAGSDGHIYMYSESKTNSKMPNPFRLSEAIGKSGYRFVSVKINGIRKSRNVHVLICSAFHGKKPFDMAIVRHLNGNKLDNSPNNLSWGTYKDNEADKRRHGRTAAGEKQGIAKLNDEAVRILRSSIPYGLWNYIDAAKVFNVDKSVIRNAVVGKTWKHVL